MKETDIQSLIRIEAANRGWRLFRNNVGACVDQNGRMIRYGLANESSAINKVVKSSDLIGIVPRIITPADVGKCIGQFASYEVKKPGWHYSGTEREKAQLAWLNLIVSLGGHGAFITKVEEL